MNNMEKNNLMIDAKIEAILFYKGEAISIKKISNILNVSEQEIKDAILILKDNLKNRGIVLLERGDEIMLGTHGDMSDIVESFQKEELSKELSKASLETLSIILYKDSVTRQEIDYIRGVNSGFILRNMLIRGLIEKEVNPKDARTYIYKPTFELMSYMGVKSVSMLPNYQKINETLSQKIAEIGAKDSTLE
jgi:segregation and condensation protein B